MIWSITRPKFLTLIKLIYLPIVWNFIFWSLSNHIHLYIHEVPNLVENGLSVVQRSLYILRTVNAIENLDLIFKIYDNFSFTTVSSDFDILVVFWVKNWVPFWLVIGHFHDHLLKYLGETWSEVRLNGEESVANFGRKISCIFEIYGL